MLWRADPEESQFLVRDRGARTFIVCTCAIWDNPAHPWSKLYLGLELFVVGPAQFSLVDPAEWLKIGLLNRALGALAAFFSSGK